MSSRTCSLCSRRQHADQRASPARRAIPAPGTVQDLSGQGHPFFALLAFGFGDVGSQQELDRLEIVVQPVLRGDGFQPGLLGLLLGPQSGQVADPQQEGARQRQDHRAAMTPTLVEELSRGCRRVHLRTRSRSEGSGAYFSGRCSNCRWRSSWSSRAV